MVQYSIYRHTYMHAYIHTYTFYIPIQSYIPGMRICTYLYVCMSSVCNACMHACMDGWTDGRMDGWMEM